MQAYSGLVNMIDVRSYSDRLLRPALAFPTCRYGLAKVLSGCSRNFRQLLFARHVLLILVLFDVGRYLAGGMWVNVAFVVW